MRLTIALLSVLLFAPHVAHAADPPDEPTQAKLFFEKGMAHFQLEEYDAAIEKWEAGFRIRPVPEFLYNIAQAYRLSRRHDRALSFYQKYLRMSPKAPNRADVEKHIATLKTLVEQNQRVAALPPREPLSQSGRPSPQNAPLDPAPREPGVEPSQPPPTTATPSEPARSDASLTKTPKDDRPVTKKPWFWAVIGVGAAVVVGAVVVGAVVGTQSSGPQQLPELRF